MTSDPTPGPVREPAPAHATGYRVLVTGSRTWADTTTITRALDNLHARHGDELRVVHGACPTGADAIAHDWATRQGVPVEAHPADWSTGKGAGPARNAAMIATDPDQCHAFIADASRGATGTADLADVAGIPTTRHTAPSGASASGPRDGQLVAQDDDQLIAIVDGPMAEQWFTWSDWQDRLRAARHNEERCGHRAPALDYVPAGYQVANPVLDHTRGWAAVHQPTQSTTPTHSVRTPAAADGDAQDRGVGAQDATTWDDEDGHDDAYELAG